MRGTIVKVEPHLDCIDVTYKYQNGKRKVVRAHDLSPSQRTQSYTRGKAWLNREAIKKALHNINDVDGHKMGDNLLDDVIDRWVVYKTKHDSKFDISEALKDKEAMNELAQATWSYEDRVHTVEQLRKMKFPKKLPHSKGKGKGKDAKEAQPQQQQQQQKPTLKTADIKTKVYREMIFYANSNLQSLPRDWKALTDKWMEYLQELIPGYTWLKLLKSNRFLDIAETLTNSELMKDVRKNMREFIPNTSDERKKAKELGWLS